MADRSKIEWTDASWNPLRARNKETGGVGHFCVHVSEGCRNCYAERMQPRFQNPVRYAVQDQSKVDLFLDERALDQPLRWKKPRMIFVCSMTDLFAEFVPDDQIRRMFAVMSLAQRHTFQILTKRPDRMKTYMNGPKMDEMRRRFWSPMPVRPLPNVWLGTSCEDQKTADERIPHLLTTPAAVRFVSCEPLLSGLDLRCLHHDGITNIDALTGTHGLTFPLNGRGPHLDWVIVGGESGPNYRPMDLAWARSIRDQCRAACVPFFMKQTAGKKAIPDDLMKRDMP